jgi:signal recognition particle receptor subunit beta
LSFLNYSTKEINFKIVYYGPGLSGKTTNIKHIYTKIKKENKGKLVSLATETERTLFFDFVPFDLGTIRGYKVKIHLYTVPGQIYYSSSRKLILKGVDGIVFVADSQRERFEANLESYSDMLKNLNDYNIVFDNIPYILQLNKRDLPNVTSTEDLIRALRRKDEPVVEAVALKGTGVIETLKKVSKIVMVNVKNKLR